MISLIASIVEGQREQAEARARDVAVRVLGEAAAAKLLFDPMFPGVGEGRRSRLFVIQLPSDSVSAAEVEALVRELSTLEVFEYVETPHPRTPQRA